MRDKELEKLAGIALDHALDKGAEQVAVRASRSRWVDLKRREGKTETVEASTSRDISIALFVDGRYSSNSTSFLKKEPVCNFVDECFAMTKMLAPDPARGLADSDMYGPTKGVDLDLCDKEFDSVDMPIRNEWVEKIEEAAKVVDSSIISVTSEATTQETEYLQVHSNGFRGEKETTSFSLSAGVTVKDPDSDRRPEDYYWASTRHFKDLPDPAEIGREAAKRAVARIGAQKMPTEQMTLVVENRAARRLFSSLLGPLQGGALQQKRSCFEGMLGKIIGSSNLTLVDKPLLPRQLGSKTFDGDGLAVKEFPVFENGKLSTYFIDVYYGRKLKRDPTTGSTSNLVLEPGKADLRQVIKNVKKGILVTGFLGGNDNSSTGDFSFGISGHLIENGVCAKPVNEMNIADNHLKLWTRLSEVGNDPYPYSAWQIPCLVFDDVQFSGN